MKFVLFVEGDLEGKAFPEFLKRWLDPQLSNPVGIKPVRFEGWSDYVKETGKKVALNLSGHAGADVISAIGVLDLYGPTFYPAHSRTAAERLSWAKEQIERSVSNSNFRQHFAVHEAEAWLLSDPFIFPEQVGEALRGKVASPEDADFDEPPARLLERLYWEKLHRSYRKVIDGVSLFRRLAPGRAYERCPRLRFLLDCMLNLARARGL